ncbi:MAG: type II secretion system F family protein, partial [Acidobacteria bacterium]|nr:type II secretion system F family protein [Acidobacteriota bacterium]
AGERVTGTRSAATVDAAVAALRGERIVVTRIEAAAEPRTRRRGEAGKAVAPRNLALFTRQLAVMTGAGLPLVECLDILGRQEEDSRLRATIVQVRAHVEGGESLAAAMARYPVTFDALYTNMIAAGEAGGVLDTILKRLAAYIEATVRIRARVKSALTYPVAVVVISAIVVAAILWKVVPTFTSLFDGLGAVLPLPTRIVIAASDGVAVAGPLLLLAAAAGALAMRRFYGTPRGRRLVDGAALRLPAVGSILRKVQVARFCRTLGTLLSSGVPILDGLEITARTSGNAVIADAVLAARGSIEAGESVAGPLEHTRVFPAMATRMISVGEATGALDAMLEKVARFYDEEVALAVGSLLTLLEPVMIAVLGLVVGGIVFAMYMPIFDLISRLGV